MAEEVEQQGTTTETEPRSFNGRTKKPGLSIFFPVYNDWGTIGSMVALALDTAEKVTDDFEVILVNDGSEQHTVDVLNFLEKNFDRVRVVHHPQNRGYGCALRTGFKEARKEFVFYTDGDAQYDVRELEKLVPFMRDDVDWVNGYKIKRNDPLHRVIIGKIYHHVTKLAFGFPIRDVDCDFRLIRKEILNQVELESTSGTICVEMIKKFSDYGFNYAEVPVHHYFRASGKSQFFNFKRLFKVTIDLLKLWWKLVVKREHLKKRQTENR
ncbi:MAG: glycosyltransferase family 2 protein [Calditrichaeota bacterium]|nr:glycosyltransferase family 2 protein [Calditrichota bacterium]